MKIYDFIITMAFILSVLLSPTFGKDHSVYAEGEACAVNSPSSGNYSVDFCITSPTNGSTLSGDINVTSSFSTTGSAPGIQRVIFYLNNDYLLTDFESAYSFLLPTSKFVDGNYTLSVVVVMRDGYVFQMGSVTVNFSNGNITTPVNSNTFQIFTSPTHANGQPFMVAAGGDGASGITNSANVTNLISGLNPDMFLYLGDVYNKGTYTEFINWYGNEQSFFGQFKSITNPIVGNHEYENGEAPGYFDYWDNVPDYYSYDAGGWHFIALNSNYSVVPVKSGSAQYEWLQTDLNANSDKCTVVYFHHPLFNIGPPSSTTELMDIWNLLVQAEVEIALTGHDHTYQRWSPLGINGQPDPNGITQFVAGASGHGVQTISKSDDRVAFFSDANPGALGVLMLGLNAEGANYSYINTTGEIIDSGVIPCSTENQDTQAPTIPGNISVNVVNSTQVDVSWTNSIDNTGVAGYTIYRDGVAIGNVSSGSTSFQDSDLFPEMTYSFTVDAYDLAGNNSGQSEPVVVSTPPLPGTIMYSVESDAYVSSVNTTSNYGRATTLRMDASPDVHSYLRFVVQGLAGNPIESARLQIFSNTTSSLGFNVKEVLDNSWSKYLMNYNNAPELGNLISSSGSITSGSWVELDVTSFVSGEGVFSFGLDTTSSSAMSVASRESGMNSALLLIDLQLNGADNLPPTTPSGLAASLNMNPLSVGLSWSPSIDNVGVAGYSIYRNGEHLSDVSGDTLTFIDSTVLPLSDYIYTVTAYDLAGNYSPVSDAVSLSTPENQPPSVPNDLSAIVNETGAARISWTASTDNVAVTGYTLYRDDVVLTTLTSSDLSYIDTTVTTGFSYSYSVDAFDQAGNRSERSISVFLNIADNQSPSTPSGLSASIVGTFQVELSWNPSSDNVEVIGYSVLRNGISIDTVTGTTLTYTDSSVSPNVEYTYTIAAFDQAGNHSTESDPVIVSVPDLPQVLKLTPEADAYVDASKPTMNYGNSTTLRADASPDLHAFLRFNIPDLGVKSISRAQLFFYANSNIRKDIQILEVANNTWSENTIIYSNAPVLGNIVSSISSVSTGSWAVFDVTSYINRSGDFSFGLVNTSSTSINLASRESGANSPYLVLDLFTAVPDNTAPTTPTGLVASATNSYQVNLTWNPSSDNVGVAGYSIYRDGLLIDTVSDTTLLYTDSSVSPNTEYSYSIDAYDMAGNYSSVSAPVNVITPDIPDVLTITPEADAYVNSGSPNSNYGSSSTLRADASPDLHSFIKFNVNNLGGKVISRAQLFVYANNRTNKGLNVHSVSDNTWGEGTITFNNAPVLGDIIGFSSSGNTGVWLIYDITSYITGEGLFTFGLDTPGTTSISLASRESGINSPYLLLDLSVFTPDTESPTIPTELTASVNNSSQVDLNWVASTDNVEVTGYTIYRDGLSIATVPGTILNFSDTDLLSSTAYIYSVDAFDAEGNHSELSNSVSVTTPENEPPTTPEVLSVVDNGPTHVTINWNASLDNIGVTGYTVYRDGALLSILDNQTFTLNDYSVYPGQTYSYTLDAFDNAGNHSLPSSPIQVTVTSEDLEAPTTPGGLTVTVVDHTQIDLNWIASTDNVAVNGYTLYRDGLMIATIPVPSLTYQDTKVLPGTSYAYSIDAFDQAGNHSALSDQIPATTPDLPSTLTIYPNADSYVNESLLDSNYGSATSLRVDASPILNSFMRFSVQGLYGRAITRVQLLIFANSSSGNGLDALAVSDNNWTENTINFSNAPVMDGILGSSSLVSAGTWINFDLTGYIIGEGDYSIGLSTTGLTAISLASRESGEFSPQLIIDLQY